MNLGSSWEKVGYIKVDNVSGMVVDPEILNLLFILGVVAAVIALIYFLFRGLQQDHETGEYHFTWGVGIVLLFLLGLAPGFVGLGLYLIVEKGYPLYWLFICLLIVLVILVAISLPVVTEVSTTTESVVFG